jgi:hypothetical protein
MGWTRRYDIAAWIGVAVMAAGIAAIYPPAGVIVAGFGLLVWGIIGSKAEAKETSQ